jgi:hypothetical protein
MTLVVSVGFGAGFSINQPMIGTGLEILAGSVITMSFVTRSAVEAGTDRGPAI